jgi:DNA-binding MarR family transcriptional regulator
MVSNDPGVCELVLIALRRMIRAVDLHSRHLAQCYQLTGPQLVLLKEIGRGEPLPLGELAKRSSLSNATVTGVIDRLERRGLAIRVRGPRDRRQVLVEITPAGRAALDSAPPLLQERFMRELQSLEKWEQAQLLASLERLAAMMDVRGLDASPLLTSHPPELSERACWRSRSRSLLAPAKKS